MKKSKDANWPSVGVHLDFRIWSVSKVSLFKVLELSSLSWKNDFHLKAGREFFNVLLDWKFVDFSEMGTKFKLLLRTDFSESESGKFSGMRIAVLRLSGNESLFFWWPISWSSFCALIWCKWLNILEQASWILARIDFTKATGKILESSERQCSIFTWSSLRFWHKARIVILIISPGAKKKLWAHWIWSRHWLEWEKEDAWNLERKPLGTTLEWRQWPMKWIWLQ